MKQLVEFELPDGSMVAVEVDQSEIGVEHASRPGEIAKRAEKTFQESLDRIRPVADSILGTVRALAQRPDDATVEFGIKLSAKAGAVIASTDAEAHVKITLVWRGAT